MKNIIIFFLIFLLVSSCKKSALDNTNETLPTGTVISSGNFVSNSHTTSGTAKIISDAAGKKFLVIENLKTDNGPDMRIWLSPGTSGSPYQEVGPLKAVSGNFSYELNTTINHVTNNKVLIWCEDFSVLFGHAVLN